MDLQQLDVDADTVGDERIDPALELEDLLQGLLLGSDLQTHRVGVSATTRTHCSDRPTHRTAGAPVSDRGTVLRQLQHALFRWRRVGRMAHRTTIVIPDPPCQLSSGRCRGG